MSSTNELKELQRINENLEKLNSPSPDCCYPAPFLISISNSKLLIEKTSSFDIQGDFFTPDTTVVVNGASVEQVVFVSSSVLTVTVTVGSSKGLFDLILNNGSELLVPEALEFFSLSVIDLSTEGIELSDSAIEMSSGMTWEQTTEGLKSNGGNNWGKWVRLPGLNDQWVWNRSEKRSIALIFKPGGTCMVGLGSRETNETSISQWNQGEIMGYLQSNSLFWGFYGNNGTPGNLANQSHSIGISSSNAYLKLIITNNGEPGSQFFLYQLPDGEVGNWVDTSQLLGSGTINSTMTADAEEIMPFFIPNADGFRLLGFFFI